MYDFFCHSEQRYNSSIVPSDVFEFVTLRFVDIRLAWPKHDFAVEFQWKRYSPISSDTFFISNYNFINFTYENISTVQL